MLGLARHCRWEKILEPEMEQARQEYERTGKAARCFQDFVYQTRDSWSRERRVVGQAEYLAQGPNPRLVVTSLGGEQWAARDLYERLYCARGEMENRIQEQQLDLFADRTSAETMRANPLRLWFSTLAYWLLHRLRQWALAGTDWARAQCGTLRTRWPKMGAQVRIGVRRRVISLASGCPYQPVFEHAYRRSRQWPVRA